jgi:hypothetical protein
MTDDTSGSQDQLSEATSRHASAAQAAKAVASGLHGLDGQFNQLSRLAKELYDRVSLWPARTSLPSKDQASKTEQALADMRMQLDMLVARVDLLHDQAERLVESTDYAPFSVPKERPDVRTALLGAGIEITEAKGK